MNKTLFYMMCICLAGAVSGFGQSGDTGLAFLKIGVGARAAGLGEAYVAAADEASATFWNPAGLAFIGGSEITFTHNEWIAGISNDFLAFAFPLLKGTVGLTVHTGSIDAIERRTNPSPEPLGSVNARDLALGVSYGRHLGAGLRAGLTLKYLYEKIYVDETTGFAADVGLNYQPFAAPLRFALAAQNLGHMSTFRDEEVTLPRTFRLGAAYEIPLDGLEGAVLIAADAVKVYDHEISGNFGTEVRLMQRFAVRGGFQTGQQSSSFVGGLGFVFSNAHLDYGYRPFDSGLGDTHRFSFRFMF